MKFPALFLQFVSVRLGKILLLSSVSSAAAAAAGGGLFYSGRTRDGGLSHC